MVDHSRAPFAHLYDSMVISSAQPPRAHQCERLHRPTPEDLLDLVRRSQPAVLTGLLDDWPALERWTDAYLADSLGHADVALSVSEGRFDNPEVPERWGFERNASLQGVVARPAHVPMKLATALESMHAPDRRLSGYLEYLPLDFLLAQRVDGGVRSGREILLADLRPSTAELAPSPEKSPSVGMPNVAAGAAALGSAPVLTSRGDAEPGSLPPAAWLIPRKQLLWLGGGGTVGSTHFDPYENLMVVISGKKTFHLAKPEDGEKLGGHRMMAEGALQLAETPSTNEGGRHKHGRSFLATRHLVRTRAEVGEPLDLHHYATASLSDPTDAGQTALHNHSNVHRFRCTARSGEVLYTPAYWWHEVTSEATGSRQTVAAVNWFFEPYYQRVFPNRSFDRSPQYVFVGEPEQRPLDAPFPSLDVQEPSTKQRVEIRMPTASRFYSRIEEGRRKRSEL